MENMNLKRALTAVLLSGALAVQTLMPAVAFADQGPALSTSDNNAVMKWIASRVAMQQQPFCYKQTYGRGVGVPLSTCPSNQDKNGALCYPQCNSGYSGAGPVCWQQCPSGYTDTGAFCHISKSLTAAVHTHCSGKWPWQWHCSQDCPSGYTNAGLFCALNTPSNPPGWKGDGLDLTKGSYGRGAGYPMHCSNGQQEDAGLCYSYCHTGYYGVGPVCWESCASGLTDCGAACASGKTSCGSSVANMVIAPALMVASIAALIASAGTASAATAAADESADAGLKGADAAEAASAAKEGAAAAKEAGTLDKLASTIKTAFKDFWANMVKTQGSKADAVMAGEFWKAATTGNKAIVIAKFGFTGYKVATMVYIWIHDATANFAALTTPEVNAALDKAFAGHPAAEEWVKEQYAIVNLGQLTPQDAQQTANTALSAVGLVDPTGVTGVVAAYDNPVCGANDPFPTVKILY